MKKTYIASIVTFLLLCHIVVPAQQLQTMEDTDGLKARREKTNTNFQTLLDKLNNDFTILSGKENPITVQPPLSRSSNTILQGYPRSSIPAGSTGNIFFLNNDVGGVWLKGRAGKSYQISGEEVNVEEFSSLKAAIDEFNSLVGPILRTLVIGNEQSLPTDLTIPDYVTLKVTGSGVINRNGHAITINGTFDAPLRQVFKGSGSVYFGVNTSRVYPQWWGAKLDGVRDDTAEIQAAIDSFPKTNKPHAGGEVHLTGGAIISSTLTIQKNSIKLSGKGWGVSDQSPMGGFIKWNGSAGSPMILIKNCWNSGVENIRLIGKSTAKPSAAIEYRRETDAATLLNHAYARDVWIGNFSGYDNDEFAHQFAAGLLFGGLIDGDTSKFEQIQINGCDIGVDLQNPNSSVTEFNTLKVLGCDIGVKCNTFIYGTNWNFGINGVDMYITEGHRIIVKDVTSEGSSQFGVLEIAGELYVEAGGFQVTNKIVASGYVFDGEQSSIIELKNSRFSVAPDYTYSPLFKVRLKSAGGGAGAGFLSLPNVKGIAQHQIDVTGPPSPQQRTQVIFNRPPDGAFGFGVNAVNFLTSNEAFDENRFDVTGALNSIGGPLRVRALTEISPSSISLTPTGTGGAIYSYRISAITADGETIASTAVTTTNAATLDSTHYNSMYWFPQPGAIGYKVYGRTRGGEQLLATRYAYDIHNRPYKGVITSFVDDGSMSPSGALPAYNTTGSATVEGKLSALGGQRINRTATAANYAILANNYMIAVTDTSAPRTITLPPVASVPNQVFHIVDESCGAATNNITVQCTGGDKFIDGGAASKVITANCYVLTVYSTGSAWKVF